MCVGKENKIQEVAEKTVKMVKKKSPGKSAEKKMVVCKVNHTENSGFNTQGVIFETKPALYKNKMFTFSSIIARELGYTEGTMRLTLVWGSYRKTVSFKRDAHKGGGWRSRRKEFKEFFDAVGFKENQGYEVYQVPGSRDPAFRFVKSWEWFPTGGSCEIPEGYDTTVLEMMAQNDASAGPSRNPGKMTKSSSESTDEIVWRRPVRAHKSSGEGARQVKKDSREKKEAGRQQRPTRAARKKEQQVAEKASKEQGRKVKKIIGYKEVVKFGPPGFPGRVKMKPVWG